MQPHVTNHPDPYTPTTHPPTCERRHCLHRHRRNERRIRREAVFKRVLEVGREDGDELHAARQVGLVVFGFARGDFFGVWGWGGGVGCVQVGECVVCVRIDRGDRRSGGCE